MLESARIVVSPEWPIHLSHHHGLDEFERIGCTAITCIDRAYCKKLLILLPGQRHPEHSHVEKEETFQVLWGRLDLTVNGQHFELHPGNSHTIMVADWHGFASRGGCIVEEVSTRYDPNGSIYREGELKPGQRKTEIKL